MEIRILNSQGANILTLSSIRVENDQQMGWDWIDFNATITFDLFSGHRTINCRSLDFELFHDGLLAIQKNIHANAHFEELDKYLIIDIARGTAANSPNFEVKAQLFNHTFDGNISIKFFITPDVLSTLATQVGKLINK